MGHSQKQEEANTSFVSTLPTNSLFFLKQSVEILANAYPGTLCEVPQE
jgi:hypothetical protein